MKKYINTNLFSWEFLRGDTYILWVRKTDRYGAFSGGFIEFSYYKNDKRLNLDQRIKIHCESFDEANFFVSKVLKAYYYDMPEQFAGRYHKLKKLQKICHNVS